MGADKQGLLDLWEKSLNIQHRNQMKWRDKEEKNTIKIKHYGGGKKRLQKYYFNNFRKIDISLKKEVEVLKDHSETKKSCWK